MSISLSPACYPEKFLSFMLASEKPRQNPGTSSAYSVAAGRQPNRARRARSNLLYNVH
jgi:hypothetical protein